MVFGVQLRVASSNAQGRFLPDMEKALVDGPAADRIRYFLLTPGRSGSSLLASFLADSGANFGSAAPNDWARAGEALEFQDIRYAAKYFRFAAAAVSERPYSRIARYQRTFFNYRAKRNLRHAIERAEYFKATNDVHLTVRPLVKMGYWPSIIVNYRKPDHWMFSERIIPLERSLARYAQILNNSWYLMQIYGGCAIEYDEIVTPEHTEWASALARVTGLSEIDLLASRKKRLRPKAETNVPPIHHSEAYSIYEVLGKMRGQVVERHPSALAAWEKGADR